MKKNVYLLSLIVAVLLSGCQDVIDLELENEVRSVSIVGGVTTLRGTDVEVRLTAGYFDQGETPAVSSASVVIFENGQAVDTLEHKSDDPGNYHSEFTGSIGNQYHVEVFLPEKTGLSPHWRSGQVSLSRTISMDSLSIKHLDRTTVPQAFTPGSYVLMYFTEPKGKGDYYRLRRWLNDTLFTNELFIFDDENIDGLNFGKQLPPFTIYGPFSEEGDRIRVEARSISGEHYEYLSLLSEQVYQVGSPFDPPPSPIIGNIYNADNPDEYGFGFFDASAIEQKSIVYEP